MEEKSPIECAVYSHCKSDQFVMQWAKHCKLCSIDVAEELCHENSDGVSKKCSVCDIDM